MKEIALTENKLRRDMDISVGDKFKVKQAFSTIRKGDIVEVVDKTFSVPIVMNAAGERQLILHPENYLKALGTPMSTQSEFEPFVVECESLEQSKLLQEIAYAEGFTDYRGDKESRKYAYLGKEARNYIVVGGRETSTYDVEIPYLNFSETESVLDRYDNVLSGDELTYENFVAALNGEYDFNNEAESIVVENLLIEDEGPWINIKAEQANQLHGFIRLSAEGAERIADFARNSDSIQNRT